MYKPDQVTVVRGAVDLEPTTWFAVRAESERPKVGELIQQGRHEEIYDSPEYELSLRIGSMFNFNRTSSDLQFPSGTFGSFVLPSFADLDDNTINPDSTVIVDTKVLHLKSDCYEIATSEFTLVLEENTIDNRMSPDKPKRFDMKITHQSFTCPRNVGQAQWNFTHTLEGTGPSFYFADRIWIAEICDNSTEDWMRHEATSSKRWLWGYTSDLGAKGIEFFSVWHCDYSWEAVDANLTLRARDLSVDTSVHKDPDAAFDTSAGRPWDPPIPLPRIDDEVEYTGYDIANRGSIKINDFNIPIYPDPFFKAVDKPYADLISWFRILLPPYGLLDQADLEGPEGKERVMDALNSNYRFIAAQYANLFNRLDLNRISKDIPIRPPQGLKKPVSAQVKIQVWQLYQKAVPSFIVIGILSLILVANVRGLVILLWRQRGRRGKKNSWIEGTDFPSFVPRGPNSVATGARLWAESNVKQWLPADADRMRPKELHELLRGTTFKLGWFRRKGGSRDRVFTIGVLDPEYWSEADDDESLDLR
jgi:hypothetical protein